MMIMIPRHLQVKIIMDKFKISHICRFLNNQILKTKKYFFDVVLKNEINIINKAVLCKLIKLTH
jgi:hypothetical protein